MSMADEIIAANREHPEWSSSQIAKAVGCSKQYVSVVGRRHSLSRPRGVRSYKPPYMLVIKPADEIVRWLVDEAGRMGPGIKPHDVVIAVLRDAVAGD